MANYARFLLICVAVLSLAGVASATPIEGIYSTGALVNVGQQDPYWQIYYENVLLANTYVVENNGHPGTWVPDDAYSKWIAPHANYVGLSSTVADAAGQYDYVLHFNLDAYDKDTANITFRWTADNLGTGVYLNNVALPGAPTISDWGFYSLSNEFTIPVQYLNAGANTLTFKVINSPCPACTSVPNPTGVRVQFTSADAMYHTPEPAAALLTGVGLIGLGVIFRRRRKA